MKIILFLPDTREQSPQTCIAYSTPGRKTAVGRWVGARARRTPPGLVVPREHGDKLVVGPFLVE